MSPIYILFINLTFNLCIYAQSDEPFIEGEKLEFEISDLYGNTVTSTDSIFNSKVIYITLWGTWCPPCISEIPTLINIHNKYLNDGLVIAAIAFETDVKAELRHEWLLKFIEEQKINYLVLDGGTPKNFEKVFPSIKNVEGLPVEILISRSGKVKVIRNSYGYSEVWAGRLEQEIKTLLKAKWIQ
ncbi:MAG: TlpA family protein disulfide reductase [Ignavibacteria bacterium]|nr:TlpA family protein disulfide reductase [Ignavibacteria bacterium]MBT8383521.1 TlpA family protein disulfide reductase [Ignavibacteria bacterium]NNJ52799.1 TlpA family protein disulfide reductase [Ignavibacteriaceae bacterium]NNL20023.1 TlpA family protein disulfide reductase [Ignavibacteriaceae bacterium]